MFVCDCNFFTRGIKNINKHIECCNGNNSQNVIEELQDKVKELQDEIEELKSKTKEHLIDYKQSPSKQNLPNKQTFRPIKSDIIIPKNYTQLYTNDIEKIDKEIISKIQEYNDFEESEQTFENYFDKLKENRVYTKILKELCNHRTKVFGNISLEKYIELINNHNKRLEEIFTIKNYQEKKIKSIISKGLSPLESRLIQYENYTQNYLNTDEIQRLKYVIELHTNHSKKYTQFNINNLSNNFMNYSIVLFPIEELLPLHITNKYGFNNIIFLPLNKNTENDPYSFYLLDHINNRGVKYWKMDCRLEELTNIFISNIYSFMVSMFRKLYRDVFGDNDFRKDYTNKCQITEYDCEQLLQNILLISQTRKINNILRKYIKNNSTYIASEENDKFNLRGDDALQKRRFNQKEKSELIEDIKNLFDGISTENAVDFYRSKIV